MILAWLMSVLWTLHRDSAGVFRAAVDVVPLRQQGLGLAQRALQWVCFQDGCRQAGPDGSTVCGSFKAGVAWIWKKSKRWGCPSQLGGTCKYVRVSFSQNKPLQRFPLTKLQTGRERERPQRPPSLSCGKQPEAPRCKSYMATSVRHLR